MNSSDQTSQTVSQKFSETAHNARYQDSPQFKLVSDFEPKGSQPQAIKSLVEGLKKGERFQTLLGVTGSGKTYTIANVINQIKKPTLVIAHNKTLAAQLYNEFREFFPENRVEYFVSYYDYYQPESYLPAKDQYIEKDAMINPKIEQMRLAATASLMSRQDVIVVASVSCIYGLGNPENFQNMGFELKVGDRVQRKEILQKLIEIQFERNDLELMPGRFRVKGDTIDIIPGYFDNIIRIELFGNEIDRISEVDKQTGQRTEDMDYFFVYPARHYVIPEEEQKSAIQSILEELEARLPELGLLESHRLKQRTIYDIEMIQETGSCKGIENYSRHFDHRKPGEKPFCLLDYFPEDFLMVIDESHQTIPQLHGMYNGDRSRKKNLVDYGFRLPSAYDNRPLKFDEFEKYMKNVIFVSATPGDYEKEHSSRIVEQIIRPTGLVDPEVEVRPLEGQVRDVMQEVRKVVERGDRALVTTLTKKLAEELTEYLARNEIKARYLHSDIKTIERTEIIRELRLGKFDVLVGINLLREGLDIPEVGFIGILDADKEGFLRDSKSLIQIIGRAARNANSKVVLYADNITDSIKTAVNETERRRSMQIAYNKEHGIVPTTIRKPIREKVVDITDTKHIPKTDIPKMIIELEAKMKEAADRLDFERAIQLREMIKKLEKEIKVA
ncbi:Excinuclease ABC subunit B [Methanosarcina thermophila]|jgi:excinuclease ABC subunit B|uniref:UvrABC system protein B n=3 Tax=Methanosarcina thermophila TaxID=2210 RepID=A0A0E3NI64_METTE|nr:excinuclease ABC subunit UvrB [Methanosarcina thermophila]ALK05924.1 MAG: excinuclease ABC subunit B [Methanosarcina sp. 795]AKB12536.1 Excinuclease ABC subunit B [Methanosarcina thermophila TM-1]AKB16810.1 Excinuclease ABC subunit B [Methanosarcina thermophila CHTI-55]NLU58124.1 excinuclease ABC subunit UvrB [Methanosarcina thermophila]SFT76213.1 Excinuclease ABC subunit B [Methanosarcina thermophila]